MGSIPGSGRFPGKENDNPLQYSGLENFMDRGTWQVTVHGVAESDTTEGLTHTQLFRNWEQCAKMCQKKLKMKGKKRDSIKFHEVP